MSAREYTPQEYHNPSRLEGESQEDYKVRRHNSNLTGKFSQAKGNRMVAEKLRRSKTAPLKRLFGGKDYRDEFKETVKGNK